MLGLYANPVATGLALTLFGLGLAALAGSQYVGQAAAWDIPFLSQIPVVGRALFFTRPVGLLIDLHSLCDLVVFNRTGSFCVQLVKITHQHMRLGFQSERFAL